MGVIVGSIAIFVGITVTIWRSVARSLQDAGRNGVQTLSPPTPDDHWHVAYGVNICGKWLAPFTNRGSDEYGIGTPGDGIIHIHPARAEVAGPNATLGVFADEVGLVLGDDSVRLPDGTRLDNGGDCDGVPAAWRLVDWDVDQPKAAPVVRYSGFATAPFTGDRHAVVLAYLPRPIDTPKPPTIAALDQVTDTTIGPRSPRTHPGGTVTPTTTAPTGTTRPR